MTSCKDCFVMPANCENAWELVDNKVFHTRTLEHSVVLVDDECKLLTIFIFVKLDIDFSGQNTLQFNTDALCLLHDLIFQSIIEYHVDCFQRLIHHRPILCYKKTYPSLTCSRWHLEETFVRHH
jgi:hypothetical protein